MIARVVVPPAEEPVTLAEAKAHLRMEESIDDVEISKMITAARQYVEKVCGRGLVLQTLELIVGDWPLVLYGLRLPGGHLADDPQVGVKYLDTNGVLQTLATDVFFTTSLDGDAGPGRLWRATNASWPSKSSRPDSVRVQYRVGWATPADVPEALKHAVKLKISNLYENRTPVVTGTIATAMPLSFDALLDPYRFWDL